MYVFAEAATSSRERRGRESLLPVGVADHRRELADQQDRLVPEVLELPHLREQDRVTDVEVGPRRIEARFDAQGLAALSRLLETELELALHVQVDNPAREHGHLIGNGGKGRHRLGATVTNRHRRRKRLVRTRSPSEQSPAFTARNGRPPVC